MVPVGDGANGALGVLSAVGDALAGRRIGFGRRRAALAAAFARRRGADPSAAWIAGALADAGRLALVPAPGAGERERAVAETDAPYHGARLAAALGFGGPAADAVRWHREHDDGTGFPDRLRWDGIPDDAAALGIVEAYLELVDSGGADPTGAAFALAVDAGRRFSIPMLRTFRDAVLTGVLDEAPPPPIDADDDEILAALAERIDARDERTRGRTARVVEALRPLAARLGLDAPRVIRLARLHALGRVEADPADDELDPLSRFARDRRTAQMRRAAALLDPAPALAGEAPLLAASVGWYEEGAVDPHAALVGVAVVAEALDPPDAPRRLAAAAGTQLDPELVRAYLAGLGAAT